MPPVYRLSPVPELKVRYAVDLLETDGSKKPPTWILQTPPAKVHGTVSISAFLLRRQGYSLCKGWGPTVESCRLLNMGLVPLSGMEQSRAKA